MDNPQSQMMVDDGCGLCGYIPCQCKKPQTTYTREEAIRAMVIGFALGISLVGAVLAYILYHLKEVCHG